MSELVKAAEAVRDAETNARETGAAYEQALEDLDTAKRDLIALCYGNAPLEPQDSAATMTLGGVEYEPQSTQSPQEGESEDTPFKEPFQTAYDELTKAEVRAFTEGVSSTISALSNGSDQPE